MNRRRSIPQLSALAFFWLLSSGVANAQYAAPARPGYQPAQPRFAQRATTFAPRRGTYAGPVLPYNRTPYTDDWSTGRHLPFPKPWMLPTRDPAARGR